MRWRHAKRHGATALITATLSGICTGQIVLDSTSPITEFHGLDSFPSSPAIFLPAISATLGTKSVEKEVQTGSCEESNQKNTDSNNCIPGESESSNPSSDELDDTDDEKFLSFEEWRRLNLEKSGQENRDVGKSMPSASDRSNRPSEPQHYMGDDEMEIDIGIFQQEGIAFPEPLAQGDAEEDDAVSSSKTYKERFNYASFDCAATIVKSNANMKGAGNILNENKDTYLINECGEPNKFLVVEMCQDILVDTVVLANYEFFSSMFRKIRFSVSDRFPVSSSGWKVLGEFEARSIRDLQQFTIENPLIWARYLRIEFLTHWGHEHYCPLSLLRVYGTTMMDEFKNQEAHQISQQPVSRAENVPASTPEAGSVLSSVDLSAFKLFNNSSSLHPDQPFHSSLLPSSTGQVPDSDHFTSSDTAYPTRSEDFRLESPSASLSYSSSTGDLCIDTLALDYSIDLYPLVLDESCYWEEYYRQDSADPCTVSATSSETIIPTSSSNLTEAIGNNSTYAVPHNATSPGQNSTQNQVANTSTVQQMNGSRPVPQQSNQGESRTQDSFYQTIMKRLSLLESNATLSMQYIEMQSQNLRELLAKVEKKHTSKIENFFLEFNNTIIFQLHEFQRQYSNILLSTIHDVEIERARNNRDILALSSRLSLLADDLMYQRRISMAQAIVLLTIMIFVITTRGTPMESMVGSATTSRLTRLWGINSPFDSGVSSPIRPRSMEAASDSFGDDLSEEEGSDDERYDRGGVVRSPSMRHNLPTFSPSVKKSLPIPEILEVAEDNFNDSAYLSPSDTDGEERQPQNQ